MAYENNILRDNKNINFFIKYRIKAMLLGRKKYSVKNALITLCDRVGHEIRII